MILNNFRGELPDMVDEILEHIHHLWRDVVEGDGRITAACSSISLRDTQMIFVMNRFMVGQHHLTSFDII